MKQQTITINGTTYDANTGLPVAEQRPSQRVESYRIHSHLQRSQTLNRRVVTPQPATHKIPVRTHSDIIPQLNTPSLKKNPMIQRFAPTAPQSIQKQSTLHTAPIPHSLITRTARKPSQTTVSPQPHPATPSSVLKHQAIAEAIAKSPEHNAKKHHTTAKKQPRRLTRFLQITSTATALLILGGYFTYLNMPNLSVRVAAAQSGIHATYPAYKPDGYSLNGPIAYQQGSVTINFTANGSPAKYTLTQNKSNWDSMAVLDNYITPRAKNKYDTTRENGLTIYTYNTNAAWVNGGILYTIEGDAPLSTEQIRRIAASL